MTLIKKKKKLIGIKKKQPKKKKHSVEPKSLTAHKLP